MSGTNSTPVGANDATSGAAEFNEFKEKVLKEKENWKTKAMQLETQLKEKNDSELKAKEEYKILYETERKEKEQALQAKSKLETFVNDGIKINSVKSELVKLGIDPKYLDKAIKIVDLSTVAIDPETKVALGVESAAKLIKEQFPPLFVTQTGGAPHNAPAGDSVKLSLEDYKKLPVDEQRKRRAELYGNLGL